MERFPLSDDTGFLLFDLDGVLVDTQNVELAELRRLYDRVAPERPWPFDLSHRLRGVKMATAVEEVCKLASVPSTPHMLEEVRAAVEARLGGTVPTVPGIGAALKQLLELPKIVVSNSPLEMINSRLASSGLVGHFPKCAISAYEIQCWKPDPGIYEHAARILGSDRPHLAIEDSAAGVNAAIGAGIHTLWYTTEVSDNNHLRDDRLITVFNHMDQLPDLIARHWGYLQ